MDRKINRSNRKRTLWISGAGVLVIFVVVMLIMGSGQASKTSISRDEVIFATVERKPFRSSTSLSGSIQPDKVFLLDAQESGTVAQIVSESGAQLNHGDTLLILENSDLELEVLQRESQLMEQLNNQRQTRLLINQNDLSQREQMEQIRYQIDIQEPRYRRNKQLFEKGVIARQEYEEISKTYFYYLNRLDLFKQAYRSDSLARAIELSQIQLSEKRILQNLDGVKAILDNLVITAPAPGRLSDFELQNGQSVASGDALGQIYSMDDPIITAPVDELYIKEIQVGLQGTADIGEGNFRVSVIKILPTIEEGSFTIHLKPLDSLANSPTRGQSARIRLFMGDAMESLVIPAGEFYGSTGGRWIYRVNGDLAERTDITLGKRNDQFYQIEEGLKAGDRVLISSYEGFKDYDQIKFTNQ